MIRKDRECKKTRSYGFTVQSVGKFYVFSTRPNFITTKRPNLMFGQIGAKNDEIYSCRVRSGLFKYKLYYFLFFLSIFRVCRMMICKNSSFYFQHIIFSAFWTFGLKYSAFLAFGLMSFDPMLWCRISKFDPLAPLRWRTVKYSLILRSINNLRPF